MMKYWLGTIRVYQATWAFQQKQSCVDNTVWMICSVGEFLVKYVALERRVTKAWLVSDALFSTRFKPLILLPESITMVGKGDGTERSLVT